MTAALASRTTSELEAVAEQIRDAGGRASVNRSDMTDADAAVAIDYEAADARGGLDVLVNTAGGGGMRFFAP